MNENERHKSNRRPNRKFSEEEKRSYCIAWEKSEMNRADFCEMHGISRSTLYQWVNKFKEADKDFGFSPLAIKGKPPLKQTDRVQLTISFANNPMQLSIAMPWHRVVPFIQEIGYATAIIR